MVLKLHDKTEILKVKFGRLGSVDRKSSGFLTSQNVHISPTYNVHDKER